MRGLKNYFSARERLRIKKPFKPKYVKLELKEKDKELIEEILTWAKEWEEYQEGNEIPFTEEEKYKFLMDCIRLMGYEKLEASFIEEKTRERIGVFNNQYQVDDPIGYFTKRLPELLRKNKEEKQKLPKKVTVIK